MAASMQFVGVGPDIWSGVVIGVVVVVEDRVDVVWSIIVTVEVDDDDKDELVDESVILIVDVLIGVIVVAVLVVVEGNGVVVWLLVGLRVDGVVLGVWVVIDDILENVINRYLSFYLF